MNTNNVTNNVLRRAKKASWCRPQFCIAGAICFFIVVLAANVDLHPGGCQESELSLDQELSVDERNKTNADNLLFIELVLPHSRDPYQLLRFELPQRDHQVSADRQLLHQR